MEPSETRATISFNAPHQHWAKQRQTNNETNRAKQRPTRRPQDWDPTLGWPLRRLYLSLSRLKHSLPFGLSSCHQTSSNALPNWDGVSGGGLGVPIHPQRTLPATFPTAGSSFSLVHWFHRTPSNNPTRLGLLQCMWLLFCLKQNSLPITCLPLLGHSWRSNILTTSTLLHCISVLLCSCLLALSSAQTPAPLQGQGIDPFTARAAASPVPVYMSVELIKLIAIDEHAYTFTALLLVNQMWEDPRADSAFQVINSAGLNATLARETAQLACAGQPRDISNRTADIMSPNCTAAMSVGVPGTRCTKYCTMYGEGALDRSLCCDILWLPDIEMRNLVTATRDRVALDTIQSGGGTHVLRTTRILGTFTAPLDFGHYPFDKQCLTIYVNPNPSTVSTREGTGFFIVPSATFRRVNLIYIEGPNRTGNVTGSTSDELAGWRINSFTFSCANFTEAIGKLTDIMTQEYNPNDPTVALEKRTPTDTLHEECALTIAVSRMSNTAVVSSILPVAFCSLLSFTVFFADPDDLGTRLGTLLSLFLALTAVQFIFVDILPLTSSCNYLDVFILLSYTIVVVIVLESLAVYCIATEGKRKQRWGPYKLVTMSGVGLSLRYFGLTTPPTSVKGMELKNDATNGRMVAISSRVESLGEGSSSATDNGSEAPIAVASEESLPIMKSGSPNVHGSGLRSRLETDPHLEFAYCVARRIDLTAGGCLAALYVTLAIINFSVGLA